MLCKSNVCVFAVSVLSLDMLVLLTLQAPLTWCADGDNGPGLTAEEGEKALLCPRHIVQQTLFSTLLYDHTHKNKIQLSTLYWKVGFGQPARQESVNLIVTRHWKTITCQKTFFRIYFSSSIMELQKCSLACPYSEVLEESQVIDRGLCYSKLWILSYLSLDAWWNDNHLHRWEGG